MASFTPGREGERPSRARRAARTLATLTVAGSALGAPAAALASPSIAATRPCFVNTNTIAPVTIVGSGWTPGDQIQLSTANSSLFGAAVAGADGTFTETIAGAILATSGPGVLNEAMTAADQGNDTTDAPANGQKAATAFQITNLAFSVNPQQAQFDKPVTFSFSGFVDGEPIYAHYLHRGTVVARQAFGRATGACGLLKKRMALQYPGGHPRFKSYDVQFDNSARYTEKVTPRILSALSILTF